MDNPPAKKATKKTKPKKNPIKVVYISNPMKVKTSASQFRALVQELTGQDAEFPADPTKFTDTDSDVDAGANQTVSNAAEIVDEHAEEILTVDDPRLEQSAHVPFEPLEDVFTPQMIENFSGLLPPSWYFEPSYIDALRNLDAV